MGLGRRARRRRRVARGFDRSRSGRRPAPQRHSGRRPPRPLLVVTLLALPALLTAVVGYWTDAGSGLAAGFFGTVALGLLARFRWRSRVWVPLIFLLGPLLMLFNAGPRLALHQHGTRLTVPVIEVDTHLTHHRHGYRTETEYHVANPDGRPVVVPSPHEPKYAAGDLVTVVVDPAGQADPALLEDLHPLWEIFVEIVFSALLIAAAYVYMDV
jgi:hypothetical protein